MFLALILFLIGILGFVLNRKNIVFNFDKSLGARHTSISSDFPVSRSVVMRRKLVGSSMLMTSVCNTRSNRFSHISVQGKGFSTSIPLFRDKNVCIESHSLDNPSRHTFQNELKSGVSKEGYNTPGTKSYIDKTNESNDNIERILQDSIDLRSGANLDKTTEYLSHRESVTDVESININSDGCGILENNSNVDCTSEGASKLDFSKIYSEIENIVENIYNGNFSEDEFFYYMLLLTILLMFFLYVILKVSGVLADFYHSLTQYIMYRVKKELHTLLHRRLVRVIDDTLNSKRLLNKCIERIANRFTINSKDKVKNSNSSIAK